MNKIITSIVVAGVLLGGVVPAFADCSITICANGPVVPIPANWHPVARGFEGCPVWYPAPFGNNIACMAPNTISFAFGFSR